MSRVMLIFATGLVALMAGALFYAARFTVPEATDTPAPAPVLQPAAMETAVENHPAFALPDLEGNTRDFSEWDGKHRLVNFWATWCAPCRREIPLLKTFQDTHGADGFQIVGIAVDYAEEVTRYAEEAAFNYPILIGQQDAMAVAESSGIAFIGMPFTMFVAADGELVGAYMGELHPPQLETIVDIFGRLERGDLDKDGARSALAAL